MARLVDDLLTVSKIDAGAVEAMAEEVALRDAVRDVLSDFESADIRLDAADLYAIVDPDHLHRILGNYVRNALTYGAPPVEVLTRDAGNWVEIVVRDNGAGVPDEMVPRLFGKFVRGPRSHEMGGTGLGLSIVRGLAQVNGGDTWYEHNVPQGSCFGLKLRKRDAA
jgi:signal transduction histidine kinase